MASINNHPTTQSAKDTIVNGLVSLTDNAFGNESLIANNHVCSFHEHLYTLFNETNQIFQVPSVRPYKIRVQRLQMSSRIWPTPGRRQTLQQPPASH